MEKGKVILQEINKGEKMSIKDAVLRELKIIGVGNVFSIDKLLWMVNYELIEKKHREASWGTVNRRMRELHQKYCKIDYASIGDCKFRLLWIDRGDE